MRLRIQTCRDQLLFPGVIIGCWVTGFYLKSVLLFIVAIYFILVFLLKKQVVIVGICCIGSLALGLRMLLFQNSELLEGPLSTEVLIYPDTIKVNGDLVTFEGKLPEGSILGRYQVSSREEKEQWLLRQNWQKYLQVSGEFSKGEPSRNKHVFDYEFYLDSRNFLGTLTIDEINASKQAMGLMQIHGWRAFAITHVRDFFPPQLATYINALLFGYKDHEFQEIRQMFSSSGLLHFFTVSGLHVSFFFLWLEKGLRRMRLTRGEMFGPTVCLLLVASIFFGRSISVIRAVLAYGISVLVRLFSWRISAGDQYGIVLFLTLLIDPKVFLQTSGQLCFLMTFLILMQKKVATNFYLSSQYLTLLAAPLMMHLFYEFPLFGGLLTIVFLPFFKRFLLPVSGLLFITSLFVPGVATIARVIEEGLQKLEIGLRAISRFSLRTGSIPLWLVAICLILGLLLYEQRKFVLCLLVSLFLPIIIQRISVPLSVTFIDVGQGDSIVLQAAFNREVYVIDTGGSLVFPREDWQQRTYQSNAHYSLIPFLKGEGIRQIDGLFLTHGDTDHMGNALALMAEIPVKNLYLVPGSDQNPKIASLINQLSKQTKVHWTVPGEQISRNLGITVLAPESGLGENEDSLVLQARIRETSLLFTGDLDQAGEERLIQQYPNLRADVLKLGHHGSRTSTSPVFVEKILPRIGIISCGKDNRYGHPHEEVLEVMEESTILQTDQQGMIQFSWGKGRQFPQLKTWLDYPLE